MDVLNPHSFDDIEEEKKITRNLVNIFHPLYIEYFEIEVIHRMQEIQTLFIYFGQK